MSIGWTRLRVVSQPKSSTEKAGVPKNEVHRSQLGTPPWSVHPDGTRNKKATTAAMTPVITVATVLVMRSIAGETVSGR